MRFGSVCSGIEAASVAWHPLGWRAAWLSEIEPFPSAVLAHHYPDVPNLGDMTLLPERIASGEVEAPEVFCGGTPCQAFSIAGLRKSLDDARGNLSLIFCEIANAIDTSRTVRGELPAIIFWENVPGVLNTKDNAFGCFLAGLAGEDDPLQPAGDKWTNAGVVCGPKRTVAWRVLDAQYFGVAQRRRRVFVVASARDGFDPATVLFEFDGLRRDTAPSRKARKDITDLARTLAANGGGLDRPAGQGNKLDFCVTTPFTPSSFAGYSEGVGTLKANGGDLGGGSETIITAFNKQRIGEYSAEDVASTCAARDYKDATDLVSYSIHTDAFSIGKSHHARPDGHGNHLGISEESAYSLTRAAVNAVAQPIVTMGEVAGPLDASYYKGQGSRQGGEREFISQSMSVRRLTPTECERLQGFPDGYTEIPWRGKSSTPDGPRYKALGNSWAVPVVHWIGRRIDLAMKLRIS